MRDIIRLERDYPVASALVLGIFKPIVLMSMRKYDVVFVGSDLAFSGVSFILWAFIALAVYNQEMPQNGTATRGEKIVLGFLVVWYFLLYFVLLALPSNYDSVHQAFADNALLVMLGSAVLTYVPAAMFLRRGFRDS